MLNLNESVRRFFEDYSKMAITRLFINGLFAWLLVLLWLTFRRWRESVSRRDELEDVLAKISPDVLLVVDAQHRIVLCNASVEKLFGYAPAEVLNRTTDLLYFERAADPSRSHEIPEMPGRAGFRIGTATGKRKEGAGVPLEIISADLGDVGGGVVFMRDVSEHLRLEDERRSIEQRLQHAKKLESLGVLASGIAHDFNTLLMLIQGHADLIRMNLGSDAPIRENIAEIEDAAGRAAELCEHLIAYSGNPSQTMRALDLSAAARDVLRLLSSSVGRKAAIRTELAEDLPPVVGDVTEIHQVVMNLIHNAAESLGEKPGEVRVSTGILQSDAPAPGDLCSADPLAPGTYAYLKVVDTGCGISAANKKRICDPFFTTKATGHGMGLAAVVGIVRGHRGGLFVDSTEGEGSCFTVLFPVSTEVSAPAGAAR